MAQRGLLRRRAARRADHRRGRQSCRLRGRAGGRRRRPDQADDARSVRDRQAMVSDSKIVAIPRRRGALQQAQTKKPSAGLALVNRALDDTIVNALVDAESFRAEMHRNHDGPPYLGEQDVSASGRFVERATPWMRHCLSKFARACDVSRLLADMTWMRPSALLTQADAIEMLRYLFGAMGKRRGDDAAAKLIACADIFSPTSNALGRATGLWKPVPLHPTFLALAIKHLMAAKTFEPSESELREALANVKNQVSM